MGSAAWNGLLGAFALFSVIVDRVDGGVKVWLLEGDLVVITLAKWLSVWGSEKVHTWTCKHTLTWLDDETNQTIWIVTRNIKTEQAITHKNTRYKVETQCGWKPPAAIRLYLLLIRNFFLQCFYTGAVLFQYAGSTRLSSAIVIPTLLISSRHWLNLVK